MARNKDWVVGLVTQIVGDAPTAEMVVERLMEEGFLHFGYGNADIDMVVQKFTDTFGTTKTSRQDRWAANRLIQKYGSQSVCGIIQLLADNNNETYAPVVGSITQLEAKWVSVMHFLRNNSTGSETIET